MAIDKLTIEQTDKRLPELVRSATGSAYRRAIKSGNVVVYRNGSLINIESGTRESILKKMQPRTRIVKGTKFTLEVEPA